MRERARVHRTLREPSYYNVFKDLRDPDPQRRYKAQGEMHGPGAHEITWREADLSRLQGEAVRLRLEIRNACLYSFQFQV